MKCSNVTSNISLGLNITFHIFILFVFLSVLYFTVIAPLSKKAFQHELDKQIKISEASLMHQLSDSNRKYITDLVQTNKTYVDRLKDSYSVTSDIVKERNSWIKISSYSISGCLLVIIILGISIVNYTCDRKLPIKDILIENIISFVLIGIVEFLFFTKIAFKYIPVPPSQLTKTLIESFKDNL